jgi:hypothetical protein
VLTRHDFAQYCRERQISKSKEIAPLIGVSKEQLIAAVKKLSDDDIIESYCVCSECGTIWLTKTEVDKLLSNASSPRTVYNQMAQTGSCNHR